jgi:hypothetical protein
MPSRNSSSITAWYSEKKNQAHTSVFATLRHLQRTNTRRLEELLVYAQLYQNAEVKGFSPFDYDAIPWQHQLDGSSGPVVNVVRSIVDTLYNRMSAHMPRPQFSVNGGEPTHHRTAREYNKFVFGAFSAANVYDIAQYCLKDGLLGGTGILHTFELNGEVAVERVLPSELFVDNAECRVNTNPFQMFRQMIISKQELIERYPEAEAEILAASSVKSGYTQSEGLVDMVEVAVAWKRATSKDSKDGRWVVCLENVTLLDEKYTKTTFPFSFYRFNKPALGFFGEGVVRDIVDIQIAINDLIKSLQTGMENFPYPYFLVNNAANVDVNHFRQNFGNVITYDGPQPPTAFMPQPVNGLIEEMLNWYIAKAYEISGISRMAATGEKPAGIESGVAIRELTDQQSERFMAAAGEWDRFFCDIAEKVIGVAREIAEDKGEYKVNVKQRAFVGEVDFKDLLDLDYAKLKIQVFPTGLLPSSIAGRKQTILDYLNLGFIDRDTARDELRLPDLTEEEDLAMVGRDLIRQQVERMIFDGIYEAPDPHSDIAYAQKYAQNQYLKRKLEGFPEDVLERLRMYVDQCVSMIQAAQPPPPPSGQPGPAGAPPAPPPQG